MKKALVFAMVALVAGSALAQSWGFWDAQRSRIGLGDGMVSTWYDLWSEGSGDGTGSWFNGNSLGSFVEGSNYQVYNWELRTWGDNAAGAAMWISVSAVGGPYNHQEWWQTNSEIISGTDRLWTGYVDGGSQGGDAFQLNILNGLDPGNYQLQVYIRAWGADPGEDWDSNNGANYTANFTVTPIPEPATMSLLGLGALAMVLRRKLKK